MTDDRELSLILDRWLVRRPDGDAGSRRRRGRHGHLPADDSDPPGASTGGTSRMNPLAKAGAAIAAVTIIAIAGLTLTGAFSGLRVGTDRPTSSPTSTGTASPSTAAVIPPSSHPTARPTPVPLPLPLSGTGRVLFEHFTPRVGTRLESFARIALARSSCRTSGASRKPRRGARMGPTSRTPGTTRMTRPLGSCSGRPTPPGRLRGISTVCEPPACHDEWIPPTRRTARVSHTSGPLGRLAPMRPEPWSRSGTWRLGRSSSSTRLERRCRCRRRNTHAGHRTARTSPTTWCRGAPMAARPAASWSR